LYNYISHQTTSSTFTGPSHTTFPTFPLVRSNVTAAEEATWQDTVFNNGDPTEDIINYQNFRISRTKMTCMQVETWLNDEAINFYMHLLQVAQA
jgi:Ulp1 family protease